MAPTSTSLSLPAVCVAGNGPVRFHIAAAIADEMSARIGFGATAKAPQVTALLASPETLSLLRSSDVLVLTVSATPDDLLAAHNFLDNVAHAAQTPPVVLVVGQPPSRRARQDPQVLAALAVLSERVTRRRSVRYDDRLALASALGRGDTRPQDRPRAWSLLVDDILAAAESRQATTH